MFLWFECFFIATLFVMEGCIFVVAFFGEFAHFAIVAKATDDAMRPAVHDGVPLTIIPLIKWVQVYTECPSLVQDVYQQTY